MEAPADRVGLDIPQCGAILATNMGYKENCLPFLPLCFFFLFFVLLCFGVKPVCKPGDGCSLVVVEALWHLNSVFWCSF
jgi:hypothetical protein